MSVGGLEVSVEELGFCRALQVLLTDCADGAHGHRNCHGTEQQLYKTRRTGGQEQVGGECVSISLRRVSFEVIG